MKTTRTSKVGRPRVGDLVVSVRMTRELRKQLGAIAEAERRPVTNLIRIFLEDAVAAWKKRKS